MTYTIGQRVHRIENRACVGAVILSIQNDPDGTQLLELAYDEGGTGWWPADAVEPEIAEESMPPAESVGQQYTSPSGQQWVVVQARDPDGQFTSDDPATAERESLEWVRVSAS